MPTSGRTKLLCSTCTAILRSIGASCLSSYEALIHPHHGAASTNRHRQLPQKMHYTASYPPRPQPPRTGTTDAIFSSSLLFFPLLFSHCYFSHFFLPLFLPFFCYFFPRISPPSYSHTIKCIFSTSYVVSFAARGRRGSEQEHVRGEEEGGRERELRRDRGSQLQSGCPHQRECPPRTGRFLILRTKLL